MCLLSRRSADCLYVLLYPPCTEYHTDDDDHCFGLEHEGRRREEAGLVHGTLGRVQLVELAPGKGWTWIDLLQCGEANVACRKNPGKLFRKQSTLLEGTLFSSSGNGCGVAHPIVLKSLSTLLEGGSDLPRVPTLSTCSRTNRH